MVESMKNTHHRVCNCKCKTLICKWFDLIHFHCKESYVGWIVFCTMLSPTLCIAGSSAPWAVRTDRTLTSKHDRMTPSSSLDLACLFKKYVVQRASASSSPQSPYQSTLYLLSVTTYHLYKHTVVAPSCQVDSAARLSTDWRPVVYCTIGSTIM